MCGITGFIDPKISRNEEAQRAVISGMTASLTHRGPNSGGIWLDPKRGIALGHRRLSIVELSAAGAQPLLSDCGRHVLIFNGEIYNHIELGAELAKLGHRFRGRSDTEVMLAAFRQWGCEDAVKRMVGMFAFAYVDLERSAVWLGRDRLGEKPLYYGWQGQTFLFGSELKALLRYPDWQPRIRPESVRDFLRFSYVPTPHSIYQDIYKLRPGTLIRLPLSGARAEAKTITYWHLESIARAGVMEAATPKPESENLKTLESLLSRAVEEQTSADVPVGAFLSGGIDSSLIVALMQAKGNRKVSTFSIGFEQAEFDETKYARKVAGILGTRHTELYVGPEEAMKAIPRLPVIYDEPFADSSQIPTLLVAELARSQVTVSLSGDGGDEIFAGYNRHFIGSTLWGKLDALPLSLRKGLAAALASCPLGARNQALAWLQRALPRANALTHLPAKIDKLISCLRAGDFREMYFDLISQEGRPEHYMQLETAGQPGWSSLPSVGPDPLFTMQMLDTLCYLPDDILTKVDRATMAAGLEGRAPFLDHRVVEFAWTLPADQRVRDRKGKRLLRLLLEKFLPAELIDRPKSGFAIPINQWLKGPLRPWAEQLLRSSQLREQGILRPEAVSALWANYLAGKENSQYRVWNILMLQAWLAEEASSRARATHSPAPIFNQPAYEPRETSFPSSV